MTYPLRIIFDGVVAIGPGEPEDCYERQGPLYGVMPRANRQVNRWSKLNPVEPSYIPVHFPVVFTDLTPRLNEWNVRPPDEIYEYKTYPPPYDPKHPIPSSRYSIWYPMRERLLFQFDEETEAGLLTYELGRKDGTPCGKKPDTPDATYSGDIRAVSDMREIWPERSCIRPEMLSWQAPAPTEVAAQVFVPRGHVSSGGYGRKDGVGEVAWFEPKRTKQRVEKCLVPEIVVTVDVNSFHVLCYSLDTGEKLDWLAFDLDSPADIWVGNADPGDIRLVLENLSTGKTDAARPLDTHEFDFDFELYYPLLEGEDDGGGLPVPISQGEFGKPNCYTLKVGG
jgi:hypothetical protein